MSRMVCTTLINTIKSLIYPTNAHTNYSKIIEILKTFKTTIITPTCFGLHKPSSGSSQSVPRQSYNIDFSVYMSLMNISVLWLHISFRPVVCVYRASCILHSARYTHTHTHKIYSHSTENFINDMYTLTSIL